MDMEQQQECTIGLDKDRVERYKKIRLWKPKKVFVTGSQYEGEWMDIQMWGSGTYTMPHKVVYTGRLFDGEFHGFGVLQYPCGYKVDGIWKRSRLIKATIVFNDGLEYTFPFNYCKGRDRRFFSSISQGLKPAKNERLTNEDKPRKIPKGCYDCGYGFYDPSMRCVVSAEDPTVTIKIPSATEERWIQRNCRKAWDEPIGYRPDLYERWTNGKKEDMPVLSSSSSESSVDSMLECLVF